MIKYKLESIAKIEAKGILKEVTEDGIAIIDEKENAIDVLSFSKVKELIGKSVKISIVNTEVQ